MKLWTLQPIALEDKSGPWWFPYDVALGFIVRAETEQDARQLAASDCGDEGSDAWLDQALSSCIELADLPLTTDGPAEVIMRYFNAG